MVIGASVRTGTIIDDGHPGTMAKRIPKPKPGPKPKSKMALRGTLGGEHAGVRAYWDGMSP